MTLFIGLILALMVTALFSLRAVFIIVLALLFWACINTGNWLNKLDKELEEYSDRGK